MAVFTVTASRGALGVILVPVHRPASTCSSASPQAVFDCVVDVASRHAPEGPVDDD